MKKYIDVYSLISFFYEECDQLNTQKEYEKAYALKKYGLPTIRKFIDNLEMNQERTT